MQTPNVAPISSSRPPRRPIALGPGEGESLWFLDNFITVKAAAGDGAAFGVLENALPAGSQTPLHRHDEEDEAFYVLEGELTFFLEGGRRIAARPGAYIHVPRGVGHGFRAETAARLLVLSDPHGFVELVREAGVLARRGEPAPAAASDDDRLEAACARHAVVLLGPLPE